MNKIKVWIVYSKSIVDSRKRNGTLKEFTDKFEKNDIDIEVLEAQKFIVSSDNNEIYYDGKVITSFPKYVLMRRCEIYLSRALEYKNVKVINNVNVMNDTRNKMKVHQLLSDNNIKTPQTLYFCEENKSNYENAKKILGDIFVVKYLFGSEGNGVFLVDNEDYFNCLFTKYNGQILCQKYIETSFGKDIRCYAINGKFYACALRKSNGDFRSNLSQGGACHSILKDEEMVKIVEKTAEVIKGDILGIDLLFDHDEYTVCEVNSVPGFKSLKSLYNITDADIFIKVIKDKEKIK